MDSNEHKRVGTMRGGSKMEAEESFRLEFVLSLYIGWYLKQKRTQREKKTLISEVMCVLVIREGIHRHEVQDHKRAV